MLKYINHNQMACIVLHEIYGINDFIRNICLQYHQEGADVYCPDLLKKESHFHYGEAAEAYSYFTSEIGFEVYRDILDLIKELKESYERVVVIGFSIGATIAWRCCQSSYCDAVVACYGSRIRDYLHLEPKCKTYLMFAEMDSFDVDFVCKELLKKQNTEILRINAHHGFLDKYSASFDQEKSDYFNLQRKKWGVFH
ncbi:dienelactone hydrolase family protein [Aminipila terrae]|uniref:Hydrolase n=1 Tax=Aminipila terrae TaxID=2697030 RepID=A0A6P1MET4_9FIRM|nr:dienelactone hydrolase family protein [Aminipila terrae]QHI71643.1 hydrolase [Aminipila terrae]